MKVTPGLGILLLVGILGGCADAGPPLPPELAAARERAAREPYPDLREVPPRPRLGYSIEQRRAIARRLAADRDNAAYEGKKLRYETGRAASPPRPPDTSPPAMDGRPRPETGGGGGAPPEDPGRAYVEQMLEGPGRKGELDDLIEWMEHVEALGADDGRVAAASDPTGLAAVPAAPPEAAPRPLIFEFPPGSTLLDNAARQRLRAAAGSLRRATGPIVVEAGAASPALGLERLRAVARELIALGVPSQRIEMRQRGSGDIIRILPASRPAPATAAGGAVR